MLSSAPKAQAYFGNVEDLMDGLRLRQHPMMNKPGLIAMRCGAVRCVHVCVCVQLCSKESDSIMQGHVALMSYHMQ